MQKFPSKDCWDISNILHSTIWKNIKNISFSFLLLMALSDCKGEASKQSIHSQENAASHALPLWYMDTTIVQQVKTQAQQLLSDTTTSWSIGLLHAMVSPNWHLPTQKHSKGIYKSVYIDWITYVVMHYTQKNIYPYGSNGVVSGDEKKGQMMINIDRIQNLLNSLYLTEEEKNKVIEAIWLQELYELHKSFDPSWDRDVVNFLWEMVSLLHGGDKYLLMRLHTMSLPLLLSGKLQWHKITTQTSFGWYDMAEQFYQEGMVSYLKETWQYTSFLKEAIQDVHEKNNYLIQKYFLDTKALLPYILWE